MKSDSTDTDLVRSVISGGWSTIIAVLSRLVFGRLCLALPEVGGAWRVLSKANGKF